MAFLSDNISKVSVGEDDSYYTLEFTIYQKASAEPHLGISHQQTRLLLLKRGLSNQVVSQRGSMGTPQTTQAIAKTIDC